MKDAFGKSNLRISVWFFLVGWFWQNDEGCVEHFSLTVMPFCYCHSFWRLKIATFIIFFWLYCSSLIYQYAFWLTNLESKKVMFTLEVYEALDLKKTEKRAYRYRWQAVGVQFSSLWLFSDSLLSCPVLVFIRDSRILCKVLKLPRASMEESRWTWHLPNQGLKTFLHFLIVIS